MVLTVDIGNTNIVLGGYEQDSLTFCTRISTNLHLEPDQYALELKGLFSLHEVDARSITGAIISSVVPPITETVTQALRTLVHIEPLIFTHSLPTGVNICIPVPTELGVDLLAGAAAAAAHYPLPAVVIDMGTATKLTAVDENRNLQGVSIMPGLFLALDALVSGTSQLKGIATDTPARAIGKSTVESMQSGIVFGAAGMIDGLLDRFEEELGGIRTLVATGGAAAFVVPQCRHKIELVPDLSLDGLYEVYCRVMNEKQS